MCLIYANNVQQNFITLQTKQDILIACNGVLLAIQHHQSAATTSGQGTKLAAGRMSSQHCEYIFQALRALTKTSSKFTALGGTRQLHILGAELKLEAETYAEDLQPVILYEQLTL